MAKPSKPQVSSDEALSNSSEEEQVNEQSNEEEDEEELEAVARSAGSDDDEAAEGNSDADVAAAENGDGEEEEVRFNFSVPPFLFIYLFGEVSLWFVDLVFFGLDLGHGWFGSLGFDGFGAICFVY